MKLLGVGLLGTGFMGRTHTYAYKNIAFYISSIKAAPRLIAVYSRSSENASRFAERYGFERAYSESFKPVIELQDVDIVDNSLPNFLHYEPCRYALEKDKHVICEKPLATRLSEARELYELWRKTGVKTATVFNYRFLPAVKYMKEIIDSGGIGRPLQARLLYAHSGHVNPDRPWSWKEDFTSSGGGASADLGIHAIDLARYLVGEAIRVAAVERIFFQERKDRSGQTMKVTADDYSACLIEFSGGALGIVEATRVGTGYKNYLRVEVHGTEGALSWDLEDLCRLRLFRVRGFDSKVGWEEILVDMPWWPPRGHLGGWQAGHVLLIHSFLESIVSDTPFEPSFYDGYQAQRILEAIHLSSKENRWVNLDSVK